MLHEPKVKVDPLGCRYDKHVINSRDAIIICMISNIINKSVHFRILIVTHLCLDLNSAYL